MIRIDIQYYALGHVCRKFTALVNTVVPLTRFRFYLGVNFSTSTITDRSSFRVEKEAFTPMRESYIPIITEVENRISSFFTLGVPRTCEAFNYDSGQQYGHIPYSIPHQELFLYHLPTTFE